MGSPSRRQSGYEALRVKKLGDVISACMVKLFVLAR